MKMKEWIKTQTETKGKRLRLAGGAALTGTALILAMTLGTGVRAEEVNLGEGVGRMSFQTETVDGATIYKVTSAEQMSALGKATMGTEGKTFRLETDLNLDIRSAANGNFQGVFDGNGHVIEISNLQISDSTGYTEGDNSGAFSAAASQGALFGTVSGTVKNVIVDVTAQEASYTRTSDAGVERDTGKDRLDQKIEKASSGLNLNIGDTVDELSEGDAKTAYDIIHDSASYQTVWLDENEKEAPEQTTGNLTEYRRYESDDVVSDLVGYSAKNAGQTDSFGIVCGSLTESGFLSQIRLDGEEVTVRQAGAEHAEYDSEDRRIPHYYYYKVGKRDKIEAQDLTDETLSLALEKQSTQEKSGASAALGDILSLTVTAPDRVVRTTSAGYTISYTLKIAYGDEKAHDVVLQAGEKGTWEDENGTVLDDGTDTYTVKDVKRAGRTISFTYKGTGTKTNQAMAFTGVRHGGYAGTDGHRYGQRGNDIGRWRFCDSGFQWESRGRGRGTDRECEGFRGSRRYGRGYLYRYAEEYIECGHVFCGFKEQFFRHADYHSGSDPEKWGDHHRKSGKREPERTDLYQKEIKRCICKQYCFGCLQRVGNSG